MKPTDELKKEHKAIKSGLDILEKMSEILETEKKIDISHMELMLDFIRTFADKCHHRKEEDKLFPAMIEAGIPGDSGPIAVMLAEHEIGRTHVKNMVSAVSNIKEGETAGLDIFYSNSKGYINLLRDHIDKEDNILYPLADMHLSARDQEKLSVEFDKIEKEIIGAGKHEEYHKLLDNMKSIYNA